MRTPADSSQPGLAAEVELLREELDELAVLRRRAADISNPEPTSYTRTWSGAPASRGHGRRDGRRRVDHPAGGSSR